MTASTNLAEPVRGRLDTDGRLISADPSLMRLHLHCGGYEGGPLAIPQLANLCRLSKRLGMNLSRPVEAVDDDNQIKMWVETRLQGEGEERQLSIAIVDWRENATVSIAADSAQRQRDFDRLNSLGSLRTDTALRIVSLSLPDMSNSSEDQIGQPFFEAFDIIPPSQSSVLMEALAERQPIRNQRVRQTTGKKQLYLLSGQPLIDLEGIYSGYRFSLEEDDGEGGDSSNSEIEKGNLISETLFGSQLGPALRQPLGKIIANAETIGGQLEGPLRGDYANYAKDIASAGRHLMDLVDDLSDLEAIERDGFTIAADDIDLVDLAHRAAGLLAVKASDHQIRIDLPEKEKEAPAQGEFRRVLQILVNVIGNAIRYSPDGSVIKVMVSTDDDQASISIRDQGDGIAPENLDKIFKKFERLGRSSDGGSGLGLFISRRLADAMDGSLTVESPPGRGATFTLSLPVRS